MSDQIDFETPENVRIRYEVAGLGTRFIAWVMDVVIAGLAIVFLSVALGLFSAGVRDIFDRAFSGVGVGPSGFPDLSMYALGFVILFFGLGFFVYFGFFEYILRGQTFGKRHLGIRVVKADGFALDASSVLLRSIFRVVDHLPPLWIVPVLTDQGQRFGDMIAGTLVVRDTPPQMDDIRQRLLQRSAADAAYRFDVSKLRRLRPEDVAAVESLLDRLPELEDEESAPLLEKFVVPLATRLDVECPGPLAERKRFLEDLLAAEYRRQHRRLG